MLDTKIVPEHISFFIISLYLLLIVIQFAALHQASNDIVTVAVAVTVNSLNQQLTDVIHFL